MTLFNRVFCILMAVAAAARAASAIFPLKEVKPGLQGECHTVFSGTKVEAFRFEVMGVAKDFAGPGRDIIWCRMKSDPTGQMVVAGGMSGSPCFIEGRNMGALAYGWYFNKEPVFGVQPIESMLEVFQFKDNERKGASWGLSANRRAHPDPGSMGRPAEWTVSSIEKFSPLKTLPGFARPSLMMPREAAAQMFPLPLEISGLHPLAADRVMQIWKEAGFLPQMAASGGSTKNADAADLRPGSPLTGVIAQGDLNFAATGTLTWRDGDRILAFGHPFLGVGAVNIPCGKAEIVGVVSSYERSFKMSNKGSVVGTLTQDRLSAVGGVIGLIPRMTPLTVNIRWRGTQRSFALEFCDNKFFTPVIYPTALLQFLANVMERSEESTLRLKSEIQLQGLPSLRFEDVFAGERFSWVFETVMQPAMQLMQLYQNDFGEPSIRRISVDIEILPVMHLATLEEMTVDLPEAHPGDTVRIRAVFQPWHGKRMRREYEIKLPEEVKSGEVEVILADARKADLLMGAGGWASSSDHYPSTSPAPQNLEQLISLLNRRHPNDTLHLILQRKSEGLEVQDRRLPALPESVRKLLVSDQNTNRPASVPDAILSRTQVDFGSVVHGSRSVKVRIK
ncbi:MAG: hypothetical protein HY360_03290 [Verrucomicrobia bacterium]|nr:hypothetical protein [Verrucomicrobiota bacterium]